MTDHRPEVREAVEKCLAFIVRKPDEQFAYSRCRYCDQAWWDDKEQHKHGCIVPEIQAALAAQPAVVFDQVTFVVKGGYLPADLFVENANEGDRIRIVGWRV